MMKCRFSPLSYSKLTDWLFGRQKSWFAWGLLFYNTLEHIEKWCEWLVRRVLRCKYNLIYPEQQNLYQPLQAFI